MKFIVCNKLTRSPLLEWFRKTAWCLLALSLVGSVLSMYKPNPPILLLDCCIQTSYLQNSGHFHSCCDYSW